jgi:hypothetical protein
MFHQCSAETQIILICVSRSLPRLIWFSIPVLKIYGSFWKQGILS